LTLGLRRDQTYTSANASEDARNGIVMKWDTIWSVSLRSRERRDSAHQKEGRAQRKEPHVVCPSVRE
jgi:hypothetical protein